ncbi:hypothetical protein BX616_010080 [Lobosporangium transversale]|uniref:BAG domain-containing protein n=1 Tax=Lobosporangium transversale TaxID=64571 RepID=A0A1Y2GMZ0_9FUNG|nr:hypothetical protein BCR41DRAFT_422142 [Lobosporangium transversale]KAF9913400.1 hypothetical protein BX616_010080 [Lobosporangium transversale]ORZ16129.1 hypothetical protein BCR41DRAFT_422142 [Lobosporangium transversale]|eukprot:XP_021881476.1 hypothetical protein BCR41DRAFT_422142 [Lobosporangium transversale]
MDPFSTFFRDPRLTQRPQRRQERQDFFPSFSDPFFSDPFSQADSNTFLDNDDYTLGSTNSFKPRQQRQSRQQQQHPSRQQQQQHYDKNEHDDDDDDNDDDDDDDDVEEQEEYAPQHKGPLRGVTQRRQHQQQPQQQRRQQRNYPEEAYQAPYQTVNNRQPHGIHHYQQHQHRPQQEHPQWRPTQASSKKRNHRHRRKETQQAKADQATSAQVSSNDPAIAAAASEEGDDEMVSQDATFSDNDIQESSSVKTSVPVQRPTKPQHSNPSATAAHQTTSHPERQAPALSSSGESDGYEQQTTGSTSDDDLVLPGRELQQKSLAELDQIEANLEELSKELDQILSGEISNSKRVLLTEENLTKAMLKIDAVESGGEPSIRQRRKGLIARAEQLLLKVDDFKRRTKTSAWNP